MLLKKKGNKKKKQMWYEDMFSAGEVLMHIYWKDLSAKLVHGYLRKVNKSTEKTCSYGSLVAYIMKALDFIALRFLSSGT